MWRMARVAALVGVGVFVLAPATAREAPLAGSPPAEKPSPLLGIVWAEENRDASLVSVEPRSLRPLSGRTLSLFGYPGPWAFSQDRKTLALAGSCQRGQGLSAGITFVDAARLRPKGCLWVGGVTAMAWPEPRRLLAVASEVVSIDPVGRRILARSPLPDGYVVGVKSVGGGLVLLVASGGYGRLVVVDERGAVRSAALELPAGVQPGEATFVRPGLAVDSVGGRAFILPPVGPVAEVSLLGRLANWIEPAAQAKELPRASRTAVWLGAGMLAVSDVGSPSDPEKPGGLALVDTRTWSMRTLESGADSYTVSQGRIVAAGPRTGLAVFDFGGRLLYRRFEGRTSWVELVHRGRVYAGVGRERRLRVLELTTGKQLGHRAGPLPRLLLESTG